MDVLEDRLYKLETKLFGSQLEADGRYPEIVSTLATLGSELGSALVTRDRMMMVMKRLNELERYLDPSFGETCESENAKLDLVLMREEQIISLDQQLVALHAHNDVLKSKQIADVTSMNDHLMSTMKVHLQQELSVSQQTYQVMQLLQQYNEIQDALMQKLLNLHQTVATLESYNK